jgi:DNA-binding LacI/PurR family transcriptional regulator
VQYRTAVGADSLEGGRQAARELLQSDFGPTAIVCVNDLMAVGAMREIRERGLRIPLDVSITGFDNIALSEFCSPSLTTLHIPRARIGEMAFEYLKREPHGHATTGRDIVFDPEFIVRDSTGKAPGK